MFTNIDRPSAVDVLRPFAVGDIFTADTTSTLAKVADVAVGNVLLSGGVGAIPAWGKITLTSHVTGVLPAINGGTGVANAGTLTNASNTTITGGGTVALGGFTLTVPATGTAGLLGVANTWTQTNAFAAITATNVTDSALTADRVVFASTAGLLATSSELQFNISSYSYGSGTAGTSRSMVVDGGASGAACGAATLIRNGGASILGIGNYSAMFGGAYDATPTVFAAAEIRIEAAIRVSSGITIGSTTLLTSSVALTNGAAAQAGTLLNGPTAGNPTKWIPINDNGTTRYIPAW